jgi:hypothetical protein
MKFVSSSVKIDLELKKWRLHVSTPIPKRQKDKAIPVTGCGGP